MKKLLMLTCVALLMPAPVVFADENASEEETSTKKSIRDRVHLGGYGEAVLNIDKRGHAEFDLPRVVLMLGADLGKGWGIETDVQIESYKHVSLDQFWIAKEFCSEAVLRAGYFTLPVGATNAHDDPLEFFTVNRPVGEEEILPCDWHQGGVSFTGESGDWSYEAYLLPGVNTSFLSEEAENFWAEEVPGFEYKRGFDAGVAGRVDNNTVPGLRMSLSGYYGVSLNNKLIFGDREDHFHGNLGFLALDLNYDDHGWALRGNGNWGYRSVGKGTARSAFAAAFEGGYDLFHGKGGRLAGRKLYLFGRYDYREPYQDAEQPDDVTGSGVRIGYDVTGSGVRIGYDHRQRLAFGLNFFPIESVVIKGEYSHSFGGGNSAPMISFGIAYSGQFF